MKVSNRALNRSSRVLISVKHRRMVLSVAVTSCVLSLAEADVAVGLTLVRSTTVARSSLEAGAVFAASAESDVVVDVSWGSIRSGAVSGVVADAVAKAVAAELVEGVIARSVEGCCNNVRVRIVIPGSVVADGVPWPGKVGLPGGVSPRAASWVAYVFGSRGFLL